MKNKFTILLLAAVINAASSQNTVDFESFTLAPNSAYSSTASVPFSTVGATFEHTEGFGFWLGGFAYTNKFDSSTAGFTNLYGVRPYKGRNNSNTYCMAQAGGTIKFPVPNTMLAGFYITNSTYAYKSMKTGDQFSKKFGGPSGNDPDYFKVIAKGYKNGALKPDSVTFLLADFTFTNNAQDYIVDSWQLVATGTIGVVDSIRFVMRSSDTGTNGMNTPGFFGMDDVTVYVMPSVGVSETTFDGYKVYPNPFSDLVTIHAEPGVRIIISDIAGKQVLNEISREADAELQLGFLERGIYFIEISTSEKRSTQKLIKN